MDSPHAQRRPDAPTPSGGGSGKIKSDARGAAPRRPSPLQRCCSRAAATAECHAWGTLPARARRTETNESTVDSSAHLHGARTLRAWYRQRAGHHRVERSGAWCAAAPVSGLRSCACLAALTALRCSGAAPAARGDRARGAASLEPEDQATLKTAIDLAVRPVPAPTPTAPHLSFDRAAAHVGVWPTPPPPRPRAAGQAIAARTRRDAPPPPSRPPPRPPPPQLKRRAFTPPPPPRDAGLGQPITSYARLLSVKDQTLYIAAYRTGEGARAPRTPPGRTPTALLSPPTPPLQPRVWW